MVEHRAKSGKYTAVAMTILAKLHSLGKYEYLYRGYMHEFFFQKKGGVALSYYDTLLHIALADIVITEPIMWQYTIVAMKN